MEFGLIMMCDYTEGRFYSEVSDKTIIVVNGKNSNFLILR